MAEIREVAYGRPEVIAFTLWQTNGANLQLGAIHAAGDTTISQDGNPEANTANAFEDTGNGYTLLLTAAELSAGQITLYIIDQGTKQWLDKVIHIFTHSHPVAYDPRGVLAAGTAQAGAADSITLATTESAVDDFFAGAVAEIIAGTGAGQAPRVIPSYVGSTKVASVSPPWTITPAADSFYRIYGTPPSTGLPSIRRGIARSNFRFLMVDATGAGVTGLSVTAERALDGGAFAPAANAVTEVSAGVYSINLASTDTDAEVVVLKFTAVGANDRVFTVLTSS